jgi:hypothetical protein
MPEWWTYRPEDFLLFSPRVYWRMFELHNAAFWPLHFATLAAGLAIIFLVLLPPPRRGRPWVELILAALWVFVGWAFLWSRYGAINWAIVYVAPAFGVQALLLSIAAARGGIALDRKDTGAWLGVLLMAAGIVAYPLLPPLFERPWTSAEVFGIAPDPMSIATLGVLLAASGRLAPLLFVIPLLWLLLSGLTLQTMGDSQAWLPFLTVATVVVVLALRR